MSPLETKLVRRLVYAPETLSRNRNFHTFNDAVARRARDAAEQALRVDEEFAPLQRELRLVERLEERLQARR